MCNQRVLATIVRQKVLHAVRGDCCAVSFIVSFWGAFLDATRAKTDVQLQMVVPFFTLAAEGFFEGLNVSGNVCSA